MKEESLLILTIFSLFVGVAIKQLTAFITQLKENDEDEDIDDDTSVEDA